MGFGLTIFPANYVLCFFVCVCGGVARRVCGVFKVCGEMALGGVWFAGSVFGIAFMIGRARLSGSSGVGWMPSLTAEIGECG